QSKAYRRAVGEYSTADIDGDGTADAVWRDGYDVLWVTIAQSDRQQSFDSGAFDAKRLDLNLANTTDEVRSANFLDYTVKLADFNGDGIADILRIKTSDKRAGANTGTLRYGLGDGSFGEAQVLTAGLLDSNLPGDATTTWSTYLADINGDGLLDLVRAGALPLGYELVVSLGTGDESKGIFSTDIKQTSTNTGGTLSFTDVNADGYSDAVFESTNDQGVVTKKVAYGRSDGGFEAIIEGSARDSVALLGDSVEGDFDGDQKTDKLYRAADGTAWVTYNSEDKNARSEKFSQFSGGQTIFQTQTMLVGDLNGDGLSDVLFAAKTGHLWARFGVAGGGFSDLSVLNNTLTAVPSGVTSMQTLLGDIDGDGTDELIRVALDGEGKATGTATLYRVTRTSAGGLLFTEIGSDTRSGVASIEDVDGDGRMDLIRTETRTVDASIKAQLAGTTASKNTTVSVRTVRLGNADGTLSTSLDSVLKDDAWTLGSKFSADFNGDGHDDTLFWQSNNALRLKLGLGDGTYTTADVSTTSLGNGLTPPNAYVFADNLFVTDLDQDGKADLVWTKSNGASIWQPGRVDTNDRVYFDTRLTISNSDGSTGTLKLLDVNDDGRLDLVRSVFNNYGVLTAESIRLGTGNGDFLPGWSALTKDKVLTLGDAFAADVNGDGNADALFRDTSNRLHIALFRSESSKYDSLAVDNVLLSNVSGLSFANTTLNVGDVDGDGRADLVLTSNVAGDARVWLRLGQIDGTFAAVYELDAVNYGLSGASVTTTLEDINGDGRMDLVRTTKDSSGNVTAHTKAAWFGWADGGFQTTALSSQVRNGKVVLGERFTADMDGDGIQDAIYRDSSNNLWVSIGLSEGGYGQVDKLAADIVGAGAYHLNDTLRIADMNADGKADLVWVKRGGDGNASGELSIWLNKPRLDGVGLAANARFIQTATHQGSGTVVLKDLDQDGLLDVTRTVWSVARNEYRETVAYGRAGAELGASQGEMFKADFNADGQADLIWRDTNNSLKIALADNTRTNGYQDWQSLGNAVGNFDDVLLVRDLNNDGKADLVWVQLGADKKASGTATVFMNTSNLTTVNFNAAVTNNGAGVASLIDINGDGHLDLIRDVKALDGKITGGNLYLGQASGAFSNNALSLVKTKGINGTFSAGELYKVDLDGDKQLDLVFHATDGSVRISLADVTRASGYRDWQTFAHAGTYVDQALLVSDINSDGKADLLWVATGVNVDLKGSANGSANFWLNASTLGTVNFTDLGLTAGSGTVTLSDIDGDRLLDLVRTVTDVNGVITARSVQFGQSSGGFSAQVVNSVDKKGDGKIISVGEQLQADFNGDGQVDLLFRDANNTVRIALGDATKATGYRQWLILEPQSGTVFKDTLSVADINGDGKVDLLWVQSDASGRPGGVATVRLSNSDLSGLSFADSSQYAGTGVVSLTDIDGDGFLDLARTVLDSAGNVIGRNVRFGQSGGVFASDILIGQAQGTSIGQISVGELSRADINGDGKADLVFRQADNKIRIALADATRANGYANWVELDPALGSGFTFGDSFALADVNGDKKADLVWVGRNSKGEFTGNVRVNLNTSNLGTVGFNTLANNSASGHVSVVDIDGDGLLDLVREEKSSVGNVIAKSVYFGQAAGGFSTTPVNGVARAVDNNQISLGQLTVVDVNGDGKDDLIFRQTDN
ncbi:MAG: VCBS repeat-containing protein, partial [Burkholderiales bacterium]|nr:VCBS repeat-containing protein [Burkholderiales bacterium]